MNKAYHVLSDPQRRQDYDQFGDESSGPSVKRKAMAALQHLIAQMIEEPGVTDLVEACRQTIRSAIQQDVNDRMNLIGRRDRLARKRDALRRKDSAQGPDLVKQMLDLMLSQLNEQLSAKEREFADRKAIHDEGLALLDQYEFGSSPPTGTYFSLPPGVIGGGGYWATSSST